MDLIRILPATFDSAATVNQSAVDVCERGLSVREKGNNRGMHIQKVDPYFLKVLEKYKYQ